MSTAPLSSAATPRSTPSLTVPTTQNTAPVIKFRCLFTHDMRRKAKRWQDGFLKYHTFNKRVMVYDTTGYFIGDLHWRQDEGIQDGDELELDRGVLIQVCEPVEKTETDISTVISKKKSQGSPSNPAEPIPSFRPSTSTSTSIPAKSSVSSQQPRSLNELLGIKKTPIGPLVSPYEERHRQPQIGLNQQSSERAAKRKKKDTTEVPREQHPSRPIRTQPIHIDLTEPSIAPPQEKPPSENPVSKPVNKSHKNSNPSRPALDALPKSRNVPEDNIRHDVEKPHTTSSNVLASTSRSVSKNATTEQPISTLRLPTDRPRKKLMYQALIPSEMSTKASNTGLSSGKTSLPSHMRSQGVEIASAEVDPLSTNAEFMLSASALFVLDEIDDSVPELHQIGNQHRQKLPSVKRDTATSASLPSAESLSGPTRNNSVSNRRQPTTSNATIEKRQMQSQPNISTGSNQNRPSMQSPPLPAAINQSAHVQGTLAAKLPPTGLRKTMSDPTALTTINGVQSRLLSSNTPPSAGGNEEADEQGPWTSEALDLFDFWPPGRPKPT